MGNQLLFKDKTSNADSSIGGFSTLLIQVAFFPAVEDIPTELQKLSTFLSFIFSAKFFHEDTLDILLDNP